MNDNSDRSDNSDNSTNYTDSNNDNSDNRVDSSNTQSWADSQNDNSNNSVNHSNNTTNMTTTMSSQELNGEVTNVRVVFGPANGGGAGSSAGAGTDGGEGEEGTGAGAGAGAGSTAGGAGQNGVFTTGDVSIAGGSFAGFAGVQTATFNTAPGALNQAATSLAANANISFGGGTAP